jgi:MscS family membrane protein
VRNNSKEKVKSLMIRACVLILALTQSARTQTAPAKAEDPLNRDTPQSAVFTFLETCHARNYERAWRFLDLRKRAAGERLKDGPQLAQQLAQVLDRDAQFDVAALSRNPEGDRTDGLPPNRDRVDTFNAGGRKLELQLERITLRSGSSVWLFSADSVDLIPQLARLASDSPVEKFLPDPLVTWKLMDTPLWRWIALALLVAALASLSKALASVALYSVEQTWKRVAPAADRSVLHVFSGPLRLLISVAGFRAGMAWIGPSVPLRTFLERASTFLFFLGLAWLGMVITDLAIGRLRRRLETRHQTFSYSVLPLASRVFKLIILLLMVTAVLSDWGYNTTTIMAGLGVGSLAIALAAQKTIENLFGGVAVISDRPVFVGDLCRFDNRLGIVEDIGLRSTRLRTPERILVTVPNALFSSMTLENLSKRDKMLFKFTLNLRRNTTPDQVRSLLGSIGRMLEEHPKIEQGKLPVRFVGVGTYSLDLEVFAYVLTPSFDEFLQVQQELFLRILDEVESAGTALAIPTQASINYASAPQANGR